MEVRKGLNTVLIEKRAPGGQAGTSSRIENYLGFPKGLSGSELSRRAITQATRFGVEFLLPSEVVSIQYKENYKIMELADGSTINTRSIIVTTGVEYRKLETKGISEFTGAGIYYGAATTEAHALKDKIVYIVGGGNSAGQGAMYLSKFAKKVTILIRKPDLTSSMSSYLIDQIAGTDNIEVRGYTEVSEAQGGDHLERLILRDKQSGEEETVEANGLFIFIGARPFTEWLSDHLIKNPRGFLENGRFFKDL